MTTTLSKLRPLADRVAVRRLERNEKTPGGIIIPQNADDPDKAWHGEVVACGPGKVREDGQCIEPRVKTGDKVLCGKYSGQELTVEGVKLLILREDEILAVVESDE